jgi:hypothetical protein
MPRPKGKISIRRRLLELADKTEKILDMADAQMTKAGKVTVGMLAQRNILGNQVKTALKTADELRQRRRRR